MAYTRTCTPRAGIVGDSHRDSKRTAGWRVDDTLQLNAFAPNLGGDLAQMEGGAGQAIELGDRQCIALMDEVETGLKFWPLVVVPLRFS